MPFHRRWSRQMCRRDQTPQRPLLPVLAKSLSHAHASHDSLQGAAVRRRRLLRTILPQGIRRHSQQEKTLLRHPPLSSIHIKCPPGPSPVGHFSLTTQTPRRHFSTKPPFPWTTAIQSGPRGREQFIQDRRIKLQDSTECII